MMNNSKAIRSGKSEEYQGMNKVQPNKNNDYDRNEVKYDYVSTYLLPSPRVICPQGLVLALVKTSRNNIGYNTCH